MRRLRLARRDDIPALQALIARSGRALSVGFYTPAQTQAIVRDVFGVDTLLIEDGTYFAIEDGDGAIVACGGWSARRTLFGGDQTKHGDDPRLDPATEPARIRAFFVAPECARRGLGRLLLAACNDAARAAGFRTLALAATLPGEPLYLAAGFSVVERFELDLDGLRVPLLRMARAVEGEA